MCSISGWILSEHRRYQREDLEALSQALIRRLFDLSRRASREANRIGGDYALYRFGAGAIGWKKMGQLSRYLDKWRR